MRDLTVAEAERFARLALKSVQQEYPNKISHVLTSDGDVAAPRRLTPSFYGCYDWHSAVHNHWLLVRLCRLFPGAGFVAQAEEALRCNLSAEKIEQEAVYMRCPERASFERPYGLAWLLQLAQELHESQTPLAKELAANLKLLELVARERLSSWLPKLPNPVRSGEHSQTAFALGLMMDYAQSVRERSFSELLSTSALRFYRRDQNWPLAYEPSGEDFLSPGLAEADLMRRVLPTEKFSDWLAGFLPQLGRKSVAGWLAPVHSPDPSDPKFSHLDGLNLSRAWMLEGVAAALAEDDPRRPVLLSTAASHAEAGLAALTGEHYVGSHWLGTFAVYLLTRRGIGHRLSSHGG